MLRPAVRQRRLIHESRDNLISNKPRGLSDHSLSPFMPHGWFGVKCPTPDRSFDLVIGAQWTA